MAYEMSPPAGDASRRRVSPSRRRRARALLPTLVVLVGLLLLFGIFTNLYTDLLWFRSVGFTKVFRTELTTKALLFVLFGALLGGSVALNFYLAYRTRPIYAPLSPEQQNLDRYRVGVEPFRRAIVLGVAALLALIGGSSAAGQWKTFLLWRNGQPFGQTDPQFGRDVSFFAFALPWWRFVLGFLFTALLLSLLAAAVTHYLYGGLRLQGGGERTSPAARVHLSVLLGLFVLAKAVAYWLDRYSLAVKDDRIGTLNIPFTGLRYVDVHALLTAKWVLAAIAAICALLFFANLVRRGWLLPGLGVGLLLFAAVLLGGIYPAVVQYFRVNPAAIEREKPYIERNIQATRTAYDIDDAESIPYRGTAQTGTTATPTADEIPGVRLIDPAVVSNTFRQLQQIRGYYGFNDSLDIDRYTVDGRETDVVIAVRELNQNAQPNRGWINDHLVYTHGFGLVAARSDSREANGEPTFIESNIPPTGALGDFEPRVYFGETSPPYSIVGGPQGPAAADREVDFPDENAPGGTRNNTYRGAGGVPVGSPFNRLLYAVKFQEEQILLSGLINDDSKVLYIRSPRERVEKVAPWLEIDGDPYPAIVDGRVLWIVDGYTTSAGYPYSTRTTLREATTDTLAARTSAVAEQPDEQVNYIRNSVKATVDAYDGTVTLYAWDDTDPVLQTWRKAFPGTVRDRSQISASLLPHLRYPQDLFKVQRRLLAYYHLHDTDATTFFRGDNFWEVPKDPTNQGTDQPPYYLSVQVPGQQRPTFSLTTTFVLRGRSNLSAFAAVEAEPGENYGKIRLLELPSNTAVPGPAQTFNAFQSNPEVASAVNLLSRGGSEVQFGNLLTLPVSGGLVYVEPVYVKAQGATAYPLLQRVRVSFGDRIGFADTLPAALRQAFTVTPGTTPPADPGTGEPQASGSPSPSPSGSASPPAGSTLEKALGDAQKALDDADAAIRRGDFAGYGAAQQRLRDAIERAAKLQGQGASPSPSASPGG